jgi:hypothetical protein
MIDDNEITHKKNENVDDENIVTTWFSKPCYLASLELLPSIR